uniref:Uncharacterized protein n=1 Tax=viral metagenome TaxID=1070528 RepID=A0A6C0KXZ1_9ZZZZ
MVRRSYKRGAGYLSPAEFFNPNALQPSSNAVAVSSAPVPGWVRPPLAATSYTAPAGGARRRRSTRKVGGFAPAVMGSFVANAQTVVVPMVLYGLYSLVGAKKKTSNNKTRKNNSA